MRYLCPVCSSELRKRAMNYPGNVKRRSIDSVYDRYVCSECDETFSFEEVETEREGDSPDWLF